MASPSPSSLPSTVPAAACAHCGAPCSASAVPGAPSFCCTGCRSAHALLHDLGLADYYRVRDVLGGEGTGRPVEAASAASFAHLDDPAVLAAHGVTPGAIELHVIGLHCAACVWVIDRLPRALPGVIEARVDYGRARLRLRWDPARIQLSAIAAFLQGLGYGVHLLDAAAEAARRAEQRRGAWRLAVAGASAGNVMLVTFALYAAGDGAMEPAYRAFFEWAALLLCIPAVTWAAWPFYRGAWAGLRLGRLHMDLPVSLGLLVGFVMSVGATFTGRGEVYFDSVATLVFLLLIGRHLQERGQTWAISRSAVLHLLLPSTAHRRDPCAVEGRAAPLHAVSTAALRVGDVIRVFADERVPADGVLVEGTASSFDQSALTGESRPVAVAEGGTALAGTTNVGAPVWLEVRATAEQTRVGQLVGTIEQASDRRAPVVELADTIAGWFVAAVLALAAIGGLVWWRLEPARTVDVVVSLLVVSCPCALGLATPIALTVARGRAAARGMLLRSAAAIEQLARADELWLDKTGTLTEGKLRVREVLWADAAPAWARIHAPALVTALEAEARHPVAAALRSWAAAQPEPPAAIAGEATADRAPRLGAVEEVAGVGVHAPLQLAGDAATSELRLAALADAAPDAPAQVRALADAAATARAHGHTVVALQVAPAHDGALEHAHAHAPRTLAVFVLGDALRPDAQAAVDRLKATGLRLAIRSGDHPHTVAAVARTLGIADARGGASPADKAHEVEGRAATVMVGDGINDAAALRAAGVGVAVGGGAEVAARVADVYLERPGMAAVAELIEGSRRAMGVVHRNVIASLLYNVVFAALALTGHMTPLLAAIVMPISSLSVIASSVFARTFDARRDGAATSRDGAAAAVAAEIVPAPASPPAQDDPLQDLPARTAWIGAARI